MTSQTKFRLGLFCPHMFRKWCAVTRLIRQHGIAFGRAAIMNVMTIDACHSTRLMRTAAPEYLFAFVMTREASRVLFFYRSPGVLSETDGNCVFTTASFDMGLAWSVASLAATCIKGAFRVRHGISHGCVNETFLLVGVTGYANVGADVVAIGLCGLICRISGRRLLRSTRVILVLA